jgi:hypothetical protein
VLVGHNFESSWASDNTDFDESAVGRIQKGQSTRAEVTHLLGKPAGLYRYPLIDQSAHEALVYLYIEVSFLKTGVSHNRKEVIITLDQKGLVKDIEFGLTSRPWI